MEYKRRQTDGLLDAKNENLDAQYVFDTLNKEFQHSRHAWNKNVPALKYKLKLPSLVSPFRELLQTVVISFFFDKLPSVNNVAQWIKSLSRDCFIEGIYFASRGFYKVHLPEAISKQNTDRKSAFNV